MLLEKTLTSNEVSEMIGKEHSRLLKDIRTYIKYLNEGKIASVDFFIESTYRDAKNEERPNYLLTKQGCEMVSNKLTGPKGVQFTAKYVSRFNQMEQHISAEQTKLPSSPMEILELTFAAQKETNERVDAIESDITDIKENQLITTEDKTSIDRMVRKKIYQICKDMRLSNDAKKLLFADLGSSIKQLFNVPHRGRIRAKDYSKAVDFVSTWEPNSITKQRIKDLNLFEEIA
ncbi:Rha family transcriptional regulator [Vagococcus fluvialis]|uniref:Rha family transcriptional regulator n=1 Tax=Vagococcus fluvialis TaxID=2738 RepID=UPI00288FFC1D|nr:Rha family transcriptional regulator [Vagococcus fluvialis]MDT2781418.1 Rha family transcriptional regulator [Vagococcus fluvialis]